MRDRSDSAVRGRRPRAACRARRWLGCALLLGACAGWAGAAPAGAQSDEPLAVSYDRDRGRLSVAAHGEPFGEVLRAVGEAAGIAVVVHADLDRDRPLHAEFRDEPLASGLERLLEGTSYVLERADGDRIAKVWVLSELEGVPAPRPPAPGPPAPPARVDVAPIVGLADLPELSPEQRDYVARALSEWQARTGEDPRDQLEELRRLVAPESPTFRGVPDEELPDAIMRLMRGEPGPGP